MAIYMCLPFYNFIQSNPIQSLFKRHPPIKPRMYLPSHQYIHPTSLLPSFPPLNNPINHLSNKKATKPKHQQSSRQTPKPRQIPLILLSGDPHIHAPETGDDVHGEDDGAEDGELAEDVGGLFLALVHADVDLG